MSDGFANRLRTRSGERWPATPLPGPRPRYCCEPAAIFAGWIEHQQGELTAFLGKADHEPAVVALRLARLSLVDYWFGVRARLSKQHLNRIANRQGHPCCYGLFLEQLTWLYAQQDRLSPPPLEVKPKPPRLPRAVTPALGGIFLGESDDRGHR